MHYRPCFTQSGSKHTPDYIGVQQFSMVHKLSFSIHTEAYTSLHKQGYLSASEGSVVQANLYYLATNQTNHLAVLLLVACCT